MPVHTFIQRSFLFAVFCLSVFLAPRPAAASELLVTFNDSTSGISYSAIGDTGRIQSASCGTDSSGEVCTLVITNNDILGLFGFDSRSYIQESLSTALSDQFIAVQQQMATSYTATFRSFPDNTSLMCPPPGQFPCTAETGTLQPLLQATGSDFFFFGPSASPEPSSILLFGAAVLAILLLARNKLI